VDAIKVDGGGSPKALRERNKRRVLEQLLEAPQGLTRPELARLVSLTVPAIATLVSGSGESLSEVLDRSSATADPSRARGTGPSPEVISIKPRLGRAMGIVLGHTQLQVAVSDLFATYDPDLNRHAEPWDVQGDLHGALARVTEVGRQLALADGAEPEDIVAIGVGIAAPVHVFEAPITGERRALLRVDLGPPGLASPWLNIDPLGALANHLGALTDGERWRAIAVHVDNDANLAALAELMQGAARGGKNVFYVRLSEAGVGAGLILDGRSYHGTGGIAGEFGHIVLEPERDLECPRCGRPCVEAVICSLIRSRDGSDAASLEDLVVDALAGDAAAKRSIHGIADYLGRALAAFVTVLNVDRIVIGGPFPPQAYSLLVPPIQSALDRLTIVPASADYVLGIGALQDDATLRGAIWLALERARVDFLLRRAATRPPATRRRRARGAG
jgi:predicted NBD/HSP70 family sugar kinase